MEAVTGSHEGNVSLEDLPIQTEEIRNSAFALGELVHAFQREIEDGTYGGVVVDQMSGHIPGFILADVINTVNKKRRRTPVPVIPIDGEKRESGLARMRHEFMHKRPVTRSLAPGTRILLVTEYISHGDTLKNFAQMFSDHDISFDVASVVISEPEQEYRDGGFVPKDTSIRAAYRDYDPPVLSRRNELIGYSRDQSGRVSLNEENKYLPFQAKADSRLLADFFVKKYFAQPLVNS